MPYNEDDFSQPLSEWNGDGMDTATNQTWIQSFFDDLKGLKIVRVKEVTVADDTVVHAAYFMFEMSDGTKFRIVGSDSAAGPYPDVEFLND